MSLKIKERLKDYLTGISDDMGLVFIDDLVDPCWDAVQLCASGRQNTTVLLGLNEVDAGNVVKVFGLTPFVDALME